MEPKRIIEMEYGKSANMMTPKIVGYFPISENIAAELSSGTGFDNDPIYGVSVAEWIRDEARTERRYDLSEMFHSKQLALRHISKLQKQFS